MKKTFGQILKELRKDKGLSQVALAKELKVGKSIISLWEKDVCEPSLGKIVAICKFFNIDGNYILGLSDFDQDSTY